MLLAWVELGRLGREGRYRCWLWMLGSTLRRNLRPCRRVIRRIICRIRYRIWHREKSQLCHCRFWMNKIWYSWQILNKRNSLRRKEHWRIRWNKKERIRKHWLRSLVALSKTQLIMMRFWAILCRWRSQNKKRLMWKVRPLKILLKIKYKAMTLRKMAKHHNHSNKSWSKVMRHHSKPKQACSIMEQSYLKMKSNWSKPCSETSPILSWSQVTLTLVNSSQPKPLCSSCSSYSTKALFKTIQGTFRC